MWSIFFLLISIGISAQNKHTNIVSSVATQNRVSANRKELNKQAHESEKIIEPKRKAKSKLTDNKEIEREKEAEEEEEREKEKKREGALQRLQRDQLMMKDPKLGYIPNERLLVAKQYKDQLMALSMGPLNGVTWKEQGPNNQGGRCRAMVVDPNDGSGNTVWAGSVGGGLWKTTNINASTPTWVPITDLFANLAITSIAFDPGNAQIMYFTTGEGYGNSDAIRGLGVWKSTDGGNTWAQLAATNTSTFHFCQKVIVSNTGVILVATASGGLQRSINGGTSFSKVLGTGLGISGAGNNFCYDVDMAANGDIYSTLDGSVHKSTNAGATFGAAQSLPITAGRIELACAPNDANYVYALIENGSTVAGILQTTDAGTTWLTRTEPDDADPGIPNADFSRGQAWYDLAIAVDPNNKDRLFVGAIDIFVSGDGANTWSQVTHWYGGFGFQNVHADQHNILFQNGSSSIAYFSNDGGIYRCTDANTVLPTITRKDYNFNTAQFYSCAIHPTAQTSHYLAGAQDNGSHKFVSNGIQNTTEVTGGDGAFCHIDQDQPQFQFTSYVYNDHYRSSDGGVTWTNVTGSGGQFINPTDYDDVNNKLYCCRNSNDYLRWDDPQTGSTFSIVSVPGFGGQVSAVKVSPNTANRVFFGISNGDIFRVDNAHTGTPTATNISTGLPSGYAACVEVETGNDNHLLVTYSNYGVNSVWESTDGGATWTSVEGNLPDMPIRWALFNPNNSDQAILATELGVWSTDDLNGNSTNWGASNSGLANVRVDMLQLRQSDKYVIAATHGRGLFASDLFTIPTAIFVSDKQLAYVNSNIQFTNYSYKGTSWSWDFGDGSPLSNSENPSHSYTNGGKYSVTLTINAGAATLTKTQYIHILPNRGTPYVVASDGGTFETNLNDFGSQSIRGGIDKWERGVPSNFLTTVNSPVNAWKTDLDADLTPGNYSCVLQTPSYNFTAAGTYTLRFRRSMEVVFCNAPFAVQVQYSTDKGLNWTRLGVDADPNATNWYNRGPAAACPIDASVFSDRYGWTLTGHNTLCTYNLTTGVPALIGQSDVTFRFVLSVISGYSGSAYAADGFMVDDFEILGPNNPASGTATIVTTGTLNPFSSCAGFVSAAQSFTVSGSGLTANLDVTAPTGYEVSLTAGSGYAATLALTPVSGNVNTTTIFVRLTNSASGTPSGNVACTSAGAITQNVAASGTVHANPAPSISGSLSFCAGGSTTLDAGVFASYLWSNGATTQSILVNTAGTFTVTVTDGNGCTGVASVTTTVHANPSPSISGSLSFCAGGSTTLDAGVFASYLWSNGATTQSILVNTAGTFTVTVTDGNGCTGLASVTTTISGSLNPSISGSLSFCAGGSTTLDAGVFASYLWSTGATTQSILVNTAGTFTVTVTDGNGCTGLASVTTTVHANPSPSISGSLSFCAGGSTTLDAGVFASYLWSNGATTQSILVNTAGTFTVTVTDGNGCTGVASVTTTVHANPSPSISGSLSFCAGGSTTLDAGVFASYLWSNGATTQSILVNTAGTFTVTVTDGNGCTGMASVTTTVHANPAPSISGSLSFCAGGSTTLDAGLFASYLWSTGATTQSILVNTAGTFTVTVTDGNGCTGMASVTTTVSGSLNPSISGSLSFCAGGSTTLDAGVFASYLWSTGATTQSILVNTAGTFTVTVTDGNGCTGMASVTTTVHANPSPSISGSLSFCAGGSTTLDAGLFASYLWSTGATTQSILVNTAGTFTVTVTDGNGCTGVASVTTTVGSSTPAQPGLITGPVVVCKNSNVSYSIAAVPGATGYTWTATSGATVSSGQGSTNVVINFSNLATNATLSVVATNLCGSSIARTLSYTVATEAPAKPATITGMLFGLCNKPSVPYSCPTVVGATSYLWSVPTGVTILSGQGTNSITVQYTGSFTGSGTLSVSAQNGCGSSALTSRIVNAKPQQPVISGQNWACKGQAGLTYTVSAVAGATSYQWIPVPGSTITSGQGTTSITYKWGNIHGVVKCIAKNACGNSIAGNLSVSFTCKTTDTDENFSDITLYPNPASETATLSFESFIEGEAAVYIRDMIGQELLNDNVKVEKGNNNYILRLSEFPKGVYLVSLKFKGISQNSRLIIQ
ncbi:MAG: T9SS type A sorting domain-containing protein [Bacteroidia bacterium]|nr:T9SS type A sorting domain-containing protein [Bacteroidia bacterium]